MPTSVRCPGCQSNLRVRPELAGKRVKCPKCGKPVQVPAEEEEELVELTLAEDEEEELEEEEEEERPRKKASKYQPCPQCGATGAKRVKATWWGSFYGPALFTHVRCPECDYAYNGRTGGSNLIPAILFVTVPLVGIIVLLGVIFYLLHSRGYI